MDAIEYFNFEHLNDLAEKEKIYYSPSVGWDKLSAKRINNNKIYFLKNIQKKILDGKYEFVPYKVNLLIKNKDSKPRKTCIPAVRDRIVISAVKMYLYDVYNTVTFNIPANNIVRNIIRIIKEGKKRFYIKLDLKAFFDNINHENLLNKIKEKIDDEIIIDLVRKILENPQKFDETDNRIKNVIGVPQGISIATLLANIYMHDFDFKYSARENVDYFRYVDDIIIFAENEKTIYEILNEIIYDLERKELLLINQEKTKSGNIEDGLEYLGYKFKKDSITIRQSSILKFERKIEGVFRNFSLISKKDDREIKKFIWLLNVKVTGILVDQKKYGWLYYFSCINDLTLLKKMDLLVLKYLKRFKLNNIIDQKKIKKFVKTYFEINNNLNDSKYLLNLNNVSKEYKQKFLREICFVSDVEVLSDEELDYRYKYNIYRTLKNLEKDIDSISG